MCHTTQRGLGLAAITLAWGLLLSGGCGREFRARRLIEVDRGDSRFKQALLGSPESLLKSGRISAARRVEGVGGVMLDVWVVKSREDRSRGTVVCFHGWLAGKWQMFSHAQVLADRGFDVLLPDLRAHGYSEGDHMTYGALERKDVKRVVATLKEEGLIHGPIYAMGHSMGGGYAVQYAAVEPDCRGVLAIAPVGDARKIMRRMQGFSDPLLPAGEVDATIDLAGKIAGFDVEDASAIASAAKLKCSLIVAHGQTDLIVPVSHGKAIHAAAPEPKDLILEPLVVHSSLLFGRETWIADQIDRLATGLE